MGEYKKLRQLTHQPHLRLLSYSIIGMAQVVQGNPLYLHPLLLRLKLLPRKYDNYELHTRALLVMLMSVLRLIA
ncbi:MAG: hypothetical protein CME43_01755 [Haliea sp.]|nr:hypothetical protein [Haliea sp.]